MKTLQITEQDALQLYPNAPESFKKQLEDNFGNELFANINSKLHDKKLPIHERINGMPDILNILQADQSKDVISIDKFDDGQHEFLKNIVAKMRICSVYNEGILPKVDGKERRYYNWYYVSSGFAFRSTFSDDIDAGAASAARLCLLNEDHPMDIFNKFPEVEKGIITG